MIPRNNLHRIMPSLPKRTSCDKQENKLCAGCNAAAYCSKRCQKYEWPAHKLLCSSFSGFSDDKRPSQHHIRALLFRVDAEKPEFTWLVPTRQDDGITGNDASIQGPEAYPQAKHLILDAAQIAGDVTAALDHTDIIENPRTVSGRKWNRAIEMIHRVDFGNDGSGHNKAMIPATSTWGPMTFDWRGNIVAIAMTRESKNATPTPVEINLTDYRQIIDSTVWWVSPKPWSNLTFITPFGKMPEGMNSPAGLQEILHGNMGF